jgi:hypothetical protein
MTMAQCDTGVILAHHQPGVRDGDHGADELRHNENRDVCRRDTGKKYPKARARRRLSTDLATNEF